MRRALPLYWLIRLEGSTLVLFWLGPGLLARWSYPKRARGVAFLPWTAYHPYPRTKKGAEVRALLRVVIFIIVADLLLVSVASAACWLFGSRTLSCFGTSLMFTAGLALFVGTLTTGRTSAPARYDHTGERITGKDSGWQLTILIFLSGAIGVVAGVLIQQLAA
jgi:hypothetical protein